MTDISDLSNCFINAIDTDLVTNIDELVLPSKQIGMSCYRGFASYGYSTDTNDLSSARFTIEVENIKSRGCYHMFSNCKNLVKGPKFTNLKSIGDYGLEYAFNNCSSLTSVELPSTSISVGHYGCRHAKTKSGIKTVENLSLSGIDKYGCQCMFLSCADLEKVKGLSAESLSVYALSSMFYKCSSLTSVQDLHIDNSKNAIKKSGNSRCDSMFRKCDSLLSVGGLIKGVYGQYGLRYMFGNCKSLKDAS